MLSAGDKLGDKLEIVRAIGAGGMGAVFEARHLRLGTRHAVKIVSDCSRGALARFEREARALAAIRHPHAVAITDIETDAAGFSYLVMEYLEGRDLEAESARGAIPVARPM